MGHDRSSNCSRYGYIGLLLGLCASRVRTSSCLCLCLICAGSSFSTGGAGRAGVGRIFRSLNICCIQNLGRKAGAFFGCFWLGILIIGVFSGIALIQLFINLLIYLAGCTFGRTGRTASARSGRILLKCFATENIADRRIILIFVSLEIQSGCGRVSACQILRLCLRSD